MENDSPGPSSGQVLALWIAGALITLSCFGFLALLPDKIRGLGLLNSEMLLFGLFHVSLPRSVVHLLLGVGFVMAAGSVRRCRTALAIAGTSIIALVVYGRLDHTPAFSDLVPTGTADAWLHFVLGLAMLGATAARFQTAPVRVHTPIKLLRRRTRGRGRSGVVRRSSSGWHGG
ncbi:hypothetical protein GCM10009789_36960 [Kribbella sancticallisti]|uniref:DUF4383 domain-containing protein n=1 Tax=Kribbella sancticallisti TaxID=460087 RepID=A0ABP4PJB0_9ACTN